MNKFTLLLIAFLLGSLSTLNAQVTTDCNDLITDLCEVERHKGQIQVGNDTLVYFIYSKPNDLSFINGKPVFSSIPLIGINGGPGLSHAYLEPLRKIVCLGTPLILYDQIATGNSTRFEDVTKFPYLFTIEHYIQELQTLISSLGLEEVHVLGHSWGTCVAQEYAILKPKELVGLVLSGALSDSQFYIESQRKYNLATLPHHVLEIINKADETKNYNSPEYLAVDEILTYFFTSRTIPTADCMIESKTNGNNDIYVMMQGASEFTVGGVLSNWNVTGKLHEIEAETLVTRGEFDTMTEECSQKIVDNLKHARKLVTIPRSGHIQMIDENEVYLNAVFSFIKSVENKKKDSFLQK